MPWSTLLIPCSFLCCDLLIFLNSLFLLLSSLHEIPHMWDDIGQLSLCTWLTALDDLQFHFVLLYLCLAFIHFGVSRATLNISVPILQQLWTLYNMVYLNSRSHPPTDGHLLANGASVSRPEDVHALSGGENESWVYTSGLFYSVLQSYLASTHSDFPLCEMGNSNFEYWGASYYVWSTLLPEP